jgi:hypothetical protein
MTTAFFTTNLPKSPATKKIILSDIRGVMCRVRGSITWNPLGVAVSVNGVPLNNANSLSKQIMSLTGSKYMTTKLHPKLDHSKKI